MIKSLHAGSCYAIVDDYSHGTPYMSGLQHLFIRYRVMEHTTRITT